MSMEMATLPAQGFAPPSAWAGGPDVSPLWRGARRFFAEIVRLAEAGARAAPLSAGERSRFTRIVLPHLDAAYNLARFLARDADAAQDITQDAFLRAFRAFADFRGEAARPWLFAIVRNCHLDWRARRGRDGAGAEPDGLDAERVADEGDDPEAALLRRSVAGDVRKTLMALPEPFREILVLREMENLSYRDIAEATGAPIGTVMSRLARARKLFGEIWLRDNPAEGRR